MEQNDPILIVILFVLGIISNVMSEYFKIQVQELQKKS